MANTDRQYIDFYGMYLYNWKESHGAIVDTHYLLLRDYVSDGADTRDSSVATEAGNIPYVFKFLYPFDIEREYFIEGTAQGAITLVAEGGEAFVTDYRVTICKMGEDNIPTEIESTGWITVNDTLTWDGGLGIGDEMVYPYFIHISPEHKVTEKERIFLKIEVHSTPLRCHLMHANDATWEDVWISIPFKGL